MAAALSTGERLATVATVATGRHGAHGWRARRLSGDWPARDSLAAFALQSGYATLALAISYYASEGTMCLLFTMHPMRLPAR